MKMVKPNRVVIGSGQIRSDPKTRSGCFKKKPKFKHTRHTQTTYSHFTIHTQYIQTQVKHKLGTHTQTIATTHKGHTHTQTITKIHTNNTLTTTHAARWQQQSTADSQPTYTATHPPPTTSLARCPLPTANPQPPRNKHKHTYNRSWRQPKPRSKARRNIRR